MRAAVQARTAGVRPRVFSGGLSGSALIDPRTAEFTDGSTSPTGRCPEIDCVRAQFAADVIDACERRAAALAVGADRVLIAAGEIGEETYLRALGERLGVTFEPLDDTPRALCPLNDERLFESAAAGMLPLAIGDELYLAVTTRGAAARRILHLIEENPARARRFRFTSAERLNRFVLRSSGQAIIARPADSLKQTWPMLSAAPRRWLTKFIPGAIVILPAIAAAAVAPAVTMLAVEVTLAAVFLAWLGLRLAGALVEPAIRDLSRGLPDDVPRSTAKQPRSMVC